MQIETIPEMALTAQDDADIAALLGAVFSTDFGGRSFYKQRHHLRIVMRDSGRVIGHMALCMRAIRMGEQLVDIIGLAEVATHPDYRKQGVATALMAAAIREAKASKADFFLLFGDEPLYAASGFRSQNNPLTFTVLDDARTHRILTDTDDKLMVRALRDVIWDGTAKIDLLGPLF